MGRFSMSLRDFGDGKKSEISNVSFNVVEPDDPADISDWLDAMADVQAAIAGLVIGGVTKFEYVVVSDDNVGGTPANSWAQRETKWLVRGLSATGLARSMEIPTANLSLAGFDGQNLPIASGAGAALKAVLDTVWVDNTGASVEVTEIVHVGRNI